MELFLTLLLAHLLADFPLQTNQLFRFKHASFFGLFVHVLVYLVTTLICIRFQPALVQWSVGLGCFHFALDWVKLRLERLYNPVGIYLVDQLLHILSLIFVAVTVGQQQSFIFVAPLPIHLLYFSDAVLLLLALMILVWIWANTSKTAYAQSHEWVAWARQQLLRMEQRIGWGLVAILLISAWLNANGLQVTQMLASVIGF